MLLLMNNFIPSHSLPVWLSRWRHLRSSEMRCDCYPWQHCYGHKSGGLYLHRGCPCHRCVPTVWGHWRGHQTHHHRNRLRVRTVLTEQLNWLDTCVTRGYRMQEGSLCHCIIPFVRHVLWVGNRVYGSSTKWVLNYSIHQSAWMQGDYPVRVILGEISPFYDLSWCY